MAANKFATMLHKNTHKIIVILIYAVLEWILIMLLLLNSLFGYCITKFAKYFGLKPPCPLCTRVDHVLEHGRDTNSYRDLLCDAHAMEVSKLSFCSDHRKLAESHLMCEDCLASRPNQNDESIETRKVGFITWVSTDKLDNGDGEVLSCCSCCKRSLTGKFCPHMMIQPSRDILDSAHKGSLIIESIDCDTNGSDQCREPSNLCGSEDQAEDMVELKIENDDNDNTDNEGATDQHHMLSSFGSFEEAQECSSSVVNLQFDEKEAYKDVKSGNVNISKQHSRVASFNYNTIQCGFGEEDLLEHINLSSCKCKCDRLLPAELIDLSTNATQGSCSTEEQDYQNETIDSPPQIVTQPDVSEEAALHLMDESAEKTSHGDAECLAGENKNDSVLNAKKHDLVDEANENLIDMQEATYGNYTETSATEEPFDPPANQVEKNGSKLLVEQIERKILISSEEAEHAAYLPQAKELVPPAPVSQEDQSTIIDNGVKNDNVPESDTTKSNLGANHMERNTMENKIISSDTNQEGISNHLTVDLDLNEVEDVKVPDMPQESLNPLDKKVARFEKRESGADESLDGSVTGENEIRDPAKTIEQLKASLETERKALNALYAELEEERSASAIAANQTMAMITRLQEEKAAMQMEALQYQRMMEEQSEYDQEALQLLNELMVKREKEKQELEKELEICRKKILDYEAKEKMGMMKGSKEGSMKSKSSVSCSNMEDGDELSIDLNREARDEDVSLYGHGESNSDNNNPAEVVLSLEEMALDCVKHISVLDDSLTEYEEERLSILDQLKVLEEKLLTIADKEFIEDVKAIRHSSTYEVNELLANCDSSSKEENEVAEDNYQERKTMVSMAKNLLPLLDEAENETDEEMLHEIQLEAESFEMPEYSTSKVDLDSNRIAIIEEVDRVYERLQALEEDREFLKHCVGSIKKGDKGMDLLQEILQHLRALRAAELRAGKTADDQED